MSAGGQEKTTNTWGRDSSTYIVAAVHAEGLDLLDRPLLAVGHLAIGDADRGDLLGLLADGVEELGHIVRGLVCCWRGLDEIGYRPEIFGGVNQLLQLFGGVLVALGAAAGQSYVMSAGAACRSVPAAEAHCEPPLTHAAGCVNIGECSGRLP